MVKHKYVPFDIGKKVNAAPPLWLISNLPVTLSESCRQYASTKTVCEHEKHC